MTVQEVPQSVIPIAERVILHAQEQNGTCNEACLLMVYRAWGDRVDEKQLVGEIHPDLGMIDSKYFGGSTHEQMKRNANLHGFAVVMSQDVLYEQLVVITQTLKYPIIVEWMSDVDGEFESDCHYSVVTHADKEKIKLADPSYGTWRTMRKEDFERKWQGYGRDGSTTKHFAMILFNNKKEKK